MGKHFKGFSPAINEIRKETQRANAEVGVCVCVG